MRIAQLAPLWECVPPKAYGGTELIVYLLCEELTKRGHEVTLFATGDSVTSAKLDPIIPAPMREIKVNFPFYYELMSVSKVMRMSKEFDIIHNHMGYQFLPFVENIDTPVVTTLHGAFILEEDIAFHTRYKDLHYVSISNSQRKGAPHLNYVATVYNGIEVEKFEFQEKPDLNNPYLAFLGRLSEEKGPHLAIQLAKKTGFKLIMAGKVDNADRKYFENKVKPLIDNKQIVYVGELGHKEKNKLLKRAYATIHPVLWPEPFGLVMAESMACGTPLLALNQGSIPEVIYDGVTGFIEDNIENLILRVKDIEKLDRNACRKYVKTRFSAEKMVDGYINTYKKLIEEEPVRVNMSAEAPATIN